MARRKMNRATVRGTVGFDYFGSLRIILKCLFEK
jgi:hypothetical protein